MANQLPWFPYFVYDFQQDEHVIPMTYEEEGLYMALLRHQWIHGSIPSDDAELQAILKPCSSQALARVKPRFKPVKQPNGGPYNYRLQNARLAFLRDRQASLHQTLSDAGRKGGTKTALTRASQPQASLKPGSNILGVSSQAQATEQSRAEQTNYNSGAKAPDISSDSPESANPEPNFGTLMQRIRTKLWLGPQPPQGYNPDRDASILKTLLRHRSPAEIACAIDGIASLRDSGALKDIGPLFWPHKPMTLRVLYNTKVLCKGDQSVAWAMDRAIKEALEELT